MAINQWHPKVELNQVKRISTILYDCMMYELAKCNYCILIADSSKFLVLLKHKQHHVGGYKILQHYKKSFNDSSG